VQNLHADLPPVLGRFCLLTHSMPYFTCPHPRPNGLLMSMI
jgi:hypothetical protein